MELEIDVDREKLRAQMHTLEGVAAALLVIMASFYATQSITITPTSSSTASKEAESQIRQTAEDLLAQAWANGDLKDAVLNWSTTGNEFNGTGTSVYYRGEEPPGDFGESLDALFGDEGVAYNIDLRYKQFNNTGVNTQTFLDNGEPTDNAVTARQMVVIHEDDVLGDGTEVNGSNYPVDNIGRNKGLYNVVEVRLTVWRK